MNDEIIIKAKADIEVIKHRIYEVRGLRVMLDRDLAELYNVETRALNQAVRRNIDRFPEDFMFVMTDDEMNAWKSQIVMSNSIRMGMRRPPVVFTELGIAMLSSVLRSETAIQVNINIMRAFVMIRQAVAAWQDTNLKVEQFWGVGEKTAQHLHNMGVFTGKQLRGLTIQQLTTQFGKMGKVLYDFARGIDERPVITEWVRKSVGCERTYINDLTKKEDMLAELDTLADELETRLTRNNFKGRTLVLKVKFNDFKQSTHSSSENGVIEHKERIMSLVRQLLDDVDFQQRPVRLLGITVTNPVEDEVRRGPVQLYIEWPPYPISEKDAE